MCVRNSKVPKSEPCSLLTKTLQFWGNFLIFHMYAVLYGSELSTFIWWVKAWMEVRGTSIPARGGTIGVNLVSRATEAVASTTRACHPERSERSGSIGEEILRCAKDATGRSRCST